jgi:hypothetical protein
VSDPHQVDPPHAPTLLLLLPPLLLLLPPLLLLLPLHAAHKR